MFEFFPFFLVDVSYLNSLRLGLWSLLNQEVTFYVYLCLERVKINLEIFLILFQYIRFLSYGFRS